MVSAFVVVKNAGQKMAAATIVKLWLLGGQEVCSCRMAEESLSFECDD